VFHPQPPPKEVAEVAIPQLGEVIIIDKSWEEKNKDELKEKERQILFDTLQSEQKRKEVSQMLTFDICATLIADELRELFKNKINRN